MFSLFHAGTSGEMKLKLQASTLVHVTYHNFSFSNKFVFL
jgi:hypothetical protein